MATPIEVMKICGVMAAAYPHFKLQKATVDIYAELLADLDADVLAVAARQVISESKFFPSASELREKVMELNRRANPMPDAAAAWQQVCGAVRFNERGGGYWERRERCDPTAIEAAERFGLTRLAARTEENASTDFAQFRDIYVILAKRKESQFRELPATSQMIRELSEKFDVRRWLSDGSNHRNTPEEDVQQAQAGKGGGV